MSMMRAYLGFDGQCQEAMTFYQGCLGGTLEVQWVGQSPAAAQMPAKMGPKVMHASLTTPNFVLMASDMVSSANLKRGESVSLLLTCESDDEIQSLFAKLSQGGVVTHPLTPSSWGSTFGHLTDKYGINWLFDHTHA